MNRREPCTERYGNTAEVKITCSVPSIRDPNMGPIMDRLSFGVKLFSHEGRNEIELRDGKEMDICDVDMNLDMNMNMNMNGVCSMHELIYESDWMRFK